jgi:hypothetical protein
MAQIVTPVADVFTGLWAPLPVWGQISITPRDLFHVSSAPDPQGDAFEVDFPIELADPASGPDAGPHRLSIHLRETDANYAFSWPGLVLVRVR